MLIYHASKDIKQPACTVKVCILVLSQYVSSIQYPKQNLVRRHVESRCQISCLTLNVKNMTPNMVKHTSITSKEEAV